MKIQNKTKNGFTVLELLIVISVIGILSVIGYNVWNVSQDQAKAAAVLKHVRRISDDFINHQSTAEGRMAGHALQYITKDNNKRLFVKNLKSDTPFETEIPTSHTLWGDVMFLNSLECEGSTWNCWASKKIDGKYTKGFVMLYLIGNQTDCKMKNALYMKDGATLTTFPDEFFTQKQANASKQYATYTINYIRGTNGGSRNLNYCAVAIEPSVNTSLGQWMGGALGSGYYDEPLSSPGFPWNYTFTGTYNPYGSTAPKPLVVE